MTMLDLFDLWEPLGLLPALEKCFHPQQRITPTSNYYIARDWRDETRKPDYNVYETITMLEKKYRLRQSRLYAIRKAFNQEVPSMPLQSLH